MKRTILDAPALPQAALDELKDWLAITTTVQDGVLTGLLQAALETCEGFTGQLPLECLCEEILPADTRWQGLSVRPVQSVTAVESVAAGGSRFALPSDAYALDLDAGGTARVRILRPGDAGRIAVRFTAGLAPDWASLPPGLRQGVIRLAAFTWRDRDSAGKVDAPPAAIAALWRPWRWLRLL